ncbi:hypothetical protein PAHAL_8G059400 [Panicum hallii]|uniref:Bifunctional inhibitor/plant lipid transfer protein/seed storage helical domain-containing protein n=1 Tax=Panicum hallii TaxID=206008 RepID=A0A2S3IDR8_9POAL|nr:hypothetical protein PAHAL_8G059400 [Panicum hallii]
MFSWKLAILILLLCSTTSPHLVTGNRKPKCTLEQKEKVLLHCIAFTERGTPPIAVHRDSVCCEAVRAVPNREMRCIVELLTDEEKKKKHDVHRILALKLISEQRSPLAPKQNKINPISFRIMV